MYWESAAELWEAFALSTLRVWQLTLCRSAVAAAWQKFDLMIKRPLPATGSGVFAWAQAARKSASTCAIKLATCFSGDSTNADFAFFFTEIL
jgi:hypothetical protein